ncbi:MAG: ATP-binding cassette domain-containing protein [Prevotella sp.]|nr:ATP-binding cassette domain-containing protein [Prevotella sp.]
MMLELHNVTIGERIRSLSTTVEEGHVLDVAGSQGSGKTTLLRAILGLIPIDGGYITIDGELLTPKSAPYFRRQTAYVPQHLSVPEGYGLDTDYLQLLRKAVESGKQLLIVDEPDREMSAEDREAAVRLLDEARRHGAIVVAVNSEIEDQQIRL